MRDENFIDLVYLWVDGNDPVWLKKKEAAIGKSDSRSAVNCDGRFADNEELRYSLRSVEKYAPWIRRIFIVTDSQVPSWLDTSNEKIRVIDHREILPPEVLPTFNSVVIEHALHRIPDLSEWFLYANDDMFFNRPVSPSDFFTAEGLPVMRMNRRPLRKFTLWFKEKVQGRTLSNYNLTIQNAARLVEQRFGRYYGAKTHHNIDAYRKSDYAETYELFRDRIEPTLANRERSADDIQRNIYSYTPLALGHARLKYVGSRESFKFHIDNPKHYDKLAALNPMLFCLNDSEYATQADRQRVGEFLRQRFPNVSSFEK